MTEQERIKSVIVEDQLRQAYLDYSMSVIVGRALPDVRDGLKPVHRRVLYAMQQMGLHHNKPSRKSARIVGDVLGKYHPHGDTAVYDSLVRMAQDFSLRYMLITGQGNFGSVDGDPPAAMRYTEAKLSKIAGELLQDIDKDTVDLVDNFDGSFKEPVVLPAKVPNLLINGSSGIAVGMTTNIPPHNLREVCDATIELIDNPDMSYQELMQNIKGPDFPTGGQICGTAGIKSAYKTGKGRVIVRARCTTEERRITIHEIPYMVNKASLIEQIANLVKDKRVEGISNLRDESDRKGMSIVIELKQGANAEVILNQLYQYTYLKTTFGVITTALVDNRPKVLGLREVLDEFIKHRKEVIVRRTKYELAKAEDRAHILEGLLIALQNLDPVIALIRGSKDPEIARNGLIEKFALTEKQAQAILDMRLQRLTGLEQTKIKDEHKNLLEMIIDYKDILAKDERVRRIIKDDLIYLKDTYGDERKTEIIEGFEEIATEDLIEEEQVVVTLTNAGYVKRLPLETYKAQKRGGRGIKAAETKEEDFVVDVFNTNSHSYILFFSNTGRVYWKKAYEIPEAGRYARGTAIVNLLKLDKEEKIQASIPVKEFKEGEYLVMATKNGLVKKSSIMDYSRPRKGGIIGINLKEGDSLVSVKLTSGKDQLIIATKDGRAVRCKEEDIRVVGRNSMGVKGINIKKSEVVGMEICNEAYILTVTEKGYGKRSEVNDYRLINRGGSGVINIKVTDKNGPVTGIKVVKEEADLLIITRKGILIRMPVKDISCIGRNTQGVRLMRVDGGDQVINIAKIIPDEAIEEELETKTEFVPESTVAEPTQDDIKEMEELDLDEDLSEAYSFAEEVPAEEASPAIQQVEEKQEPVAEVKEVPKVEIKEPAPKPEIETKPEPQPVEVPKVQEPVIEKQEPVAVKEPVQIKADPVPSISELAAQMKKEEPEEDEEEETGLMATGLPADDIPEKLDIIPREDEDEEEEKPKKKRDFTLDGF